MKKRIMAVLLALCSVLCLCSCSSNVKKEQSGTVNSEDTAKHTTINIAFNNTDSFNPFLAQTDLNRQVATLVFDPLFFVNDSFTVQSCLATAYKTEGNICTVTLKSAKFTDGSAVTAQDVIYSFNAAKKGSKRYALQLASIKKVTSNGNNVIFECTKKDPYMVNLLTFPIIKSGSDNRTDADKVALPPIGCGRYTIDADGEHLTANSSWHGGKTTVGRINLINAPDDESLSHAVEIGAIDIYYTDLSDGQILRMSGSRLNVNLNNLVYVGANQKNPMLKNVFMRQAISAALDREKITESCFYTNAVSATGIFHPYFEPTKNIQSIQTSANSKIAIENLEQMGYNRKDNTGFFTNANGDIITVRLLVNSENGFRCELADAIKTQLRAVGIKVTIEKVNFKTYTERLKNNNFDLYIAEVNILDNMDMSQILCAGGSAAYGIVGKDDDKDLEKPDDKDTDKNEDNKPADEPTLEKIVDNFYKGSATISDIAATAISEMPIIPICYRTGVLLSDDNIKGCEKAYYGNIFYCVNKIQIN